MPANSCRNMPRIWGGSGLHPMSSPRRVANPCWRSRHGYRMPAIRCMSTAPDNICCESGLARFWAAPYEFTPPGGEPMLAFEERVLNTVNELYQHRAGEHLLLVTHGGVMRLLTARARRLERDQLLQVEVGHGQRLRLQLDA